MLKGEVLLNKDPYIREFDDIEDFIYSDIGLFLNTGETYDLYYKKNKIYTGTNSMSFDEVKELIKNQINAIDRGVYV